jgi:hypothetical protein
MHRIIVRISEYTSLVTASPAAAVSPPTTRRGPRRALLLVLVLSYLISVGLLAGIGRVPDLPWSFVPFLLVLSLPVALVLVGLTRATASTSPVWRALWTSAGLALVWLSAPHVLWPAAAVLSVVILRQQWSGASLGRIAWILAALVVGYASVWNFNSLLAPLSVGRLHDPALIAFDRWLLASPGYVGVFPVFESAFLFTLLERAYLFLFAEIMTVAVWLALFKPQDAFSWLSRLFLAYAVGLMAFLVWPSVGPHIYAPESLRPAWHDTATFRAMHSMALDYQRVVGGGRGGMNYFIALPSLHVAAALICQTALRPAAAIFWVLLPVTTLVIGSTFLLGYHYALDLPAGALAAWLAWWGIERFARKSAPRAIVQGAADSADTIGA